MSGRPVQISVIGGAVADEDVTAEAEAVGRGIAEAGAVLVCGGRSGVMEAASRGARGAGGVVIGILPTLSPDDGNEHLSHGIATGVGHARNLAVVASGDAVIAIGGEWGTLSEIALARRLERPVIGLRTWPLKNRAGTELGIAEADSAKDAVEAALAAAAESKGSSEPAPGDVWR